MARTGEQQAEEDLKDVAFTDFIRYFLLAFAGVALFVGAFVIFNTISITVAQRTREFATIRTIGGSRRQILWSVILEALVIGFLASLIGLFLGLGLAAGLNALFKALNFDLPTQGLVFAPRTIIVSLLIGVIVTLLAGLFPAIRATRVPPIAAVREGFVLPSGRLARFTPYIAIVVIGIAVLLLSYSLFKDNMDTAQRLISMAVGVLALFVGVAMISSKLVRDFPIVVLAAAVGGLLPRPGTPGGRHGAFGIAILLARAAGRDAAPKWQAIDPPEISLVMWIWSAVGFALVAAGRSSTAARSRARVANHDRHRARHVRRGAGERHEAVKRGRVQGSGKGRVRPHRAGRLAVRDHRPRMRRDRATVTQFATGVRAASARRTTRTATSPASSPERSPRRTRSTGWKARRGPDAHGAGRRHHRQGLRRGQRPAGRRPVSRS